MRSVKLLAVIPGNCLKHVLRDFSTGAASMQRHYKLLVVGGGSGGIAVAQKFAHKLQSGQIGVIEPKDVHYYQPIWTLVGGGIKTIQQSVIKEESVIPKKADWIKSKAVSFDPEKCKVTMETGEELTYDYMVVAVGMQLNYDKIKGLPEGFSKDPTLCSNYDYDYVQKTWPAIQNFKGGNAIFTFPNTPIKCAGAPQKIMYLADDAWRKMGVRDKANIMFNTSLGVIFAVKKYADSLLKVVDDRNLKLNFKRNLIEVKTDTKEAVFENLDTGETETYKYDFMHVTPPMSAIDSVKASPLVDAAGFVEVNKNTLQHVRYPNVFSLGDCSSAPTSKTAAAAACQSGVLQKNLNAVMNGKQPYAEYDGYTSCPLVTGRKKCILAEFDYNANPLETFPVNQAKERWTMYQLKKEVMPQIYWRLMIHGWWNGPGFYRKLMHLGMDGPEKPPQA